MQQTLGQLGAWVEGRKSIFGGFPTIAGDALELK